jgi:hypothetical protein
MKNDTGFLRYLEQTLPEVEEEISRGNHAYIQVHGVFNGHLEHIGHNIHMLYYDPSIPDGDMMPPSDISLGIAEPHYEEYIRLRRNEKLDKILSQ